MTFAQYLALLIAFSENEENLSKPVVFGDSEQGDLPITGICLRNYNNDSSGPAVIAFE